MAELNQRIVAMDEMQLDVPAGPERAIRRIRDAVRDALRRCGQDRQPRCAALGSRKRLGAGRAVHPAPRAGTPP
ncbi:hypothetical protein ABZ892_02605 [Streptomyces sp. NPDC046924]|uniref:hypothetical protein n=1 Tax=Streptomyces sp. NPDC046924 TaxID=3155136 RepID=UPI0033C7A91A